MAKQPNRRTSSYLLAANSLILTFCLTEWCAGQIGRIGLKQQFPISLPFRSYLSSETGYTNLKSTTYRAAVGVGKQICYDVNYTFNEYGHRIVSKSAVDQGPLFVLLGDSVTFGTGLSDSETWQYYLEQKVQVNNYAVFGYGPQHILAQLETETTRPLEEQQKIALFTLLPVHMFRLMGWYINTPFWEKAPYYVSEGDTLQRIGTFESLFPVQTYLKQNLIKFNLFRLALNAFERYRTNTYANTLAQFVIQIRQTFQERFRGNLIVVLHPMWSDPLFEQPLKILKKKLLIENIDVIDFSDMSYTNHDTIGNGCDPHPGAAFTKRYAGHLLQALQSRFVALKPMT